MLRRSYRIFADYFQFYLWDRDRDPEAPTKYTDLDIARRVHTAPHVVVVQPARNMVVRVTLEVRAGPPDPDLDAWDHVAEASLDLPTGQLEIHECTGGSIDVIPIAPGTYRVRASFGGLDTLSDDGLDGRDRYRVTLWPAPFIDVAVLKQYVDPRVGTEVPRPSP